MNARADSTGDDLVRLAGNNLMCERRLTFEKVVIDVREAVRDDAAA